MKFYPSILTIWLGLIYRTSAQFPDRGVGPQCDDNNRLVKRSCTLRNNKTGICARECLQPKIEFTDICCHLKQDNAFEVYYCCDQAVPADPNGIGPIYNSDLSSPEFPYLAALGWFNKRRPKAYDYKCTSVAISSRFLLTAAHCAIIDELPANVVHYGGKHRLDPLIPLTIKNVFVHPDYSAEKAYNDIALVQLYGNYNGKTIPPWTELNFPNSSFIAAGYGNTTSRGLSSYTVLKAHLNHVTNDECALNYASENLLPNGIVDTQVCAKELANISETCQGDAGGPLIMSLYEKDGIKKTDYLIGITSFGQGCGSSSPGVYTRVSAYIDWIDATMARATSNA